MCNEDGKVFQYHRKLEQLPQFSCFFDTELFSLLNMKKSVNFLLIFTKLFLISQHTLAEVNFDMNEIHYSESCFVKFLKINLKKKNSYLISFCFCFHYCLNVWKSETKRKTLTGEMQTKNSLFHNTKLAYLWITFNKLWFFVFHKMRFLFYLFFCLAKKCRRQCPPSPCSADPGTIVEWEFNCVVIYYNFLDFHRNWKIQFSAVGKIYIICALLQNVRSCFYGSLTAGYFYFQPPCIQRHFRTNF